MRLLFDAREFYGHKMSGIARYSYSLLKALAGSDMLSEIVLAMNKENVLPERLGISGNVSRRLLPSLPMAGDIALGKLTRENFDIFISPYLKLPMLPRNCKSIHTIHDVLDITHRFYRRRAKAYVNKLRLKSALNRANLTWYDSSWSMRETKKLTGLVGQVPRVRPLGLDARFTHQKVGRDKLRLEKYNLKEGYILVIGNGLPHKNLGVLLRIQDQIQRKFVFVGVSDRYQAYWSKGYDIDRVIWLEQVSDFDLPAVMRNAFCLAQPSTAEGYGYPPLEAMACGTPAVVSDIPVLVETTGGVALRADPYDGLSWKEAFEALENKDINREKVEDGLRKVDPLRGSAGWQKHVSDIEEILTGGN